MRDELNCYKFYETTQHNTDYYAVKYDAMDKHRPTPCL